MKQNAAVEALPNQENSADFDEIPDDFVIRLDRNIEVCNMEDF